MLTESAGEVLDEVDSDNAFFLQYKESICSDLGLDIDEPPSDVLTHMLGIRCWFADPEQAF
jgi:hypothetical protein